MVVGWREWVALPDLGVRTIQAKVDTGARSSSLHAWDVEPFARDGDEWLRFAVRPLEDSDRAVVAEAQSAGEREVRSSNGEVEERYAIRTTVVLLGRSYHTELTLSRRDEMGFQMLLGRRALRNRFLVDPARSFLGGGDTLSPPGQEAS
jgi:hypothetical protein